MSSQPLITIGIPVLNEERDIERCLSSIKSQDYPADKVEVIVADGGSTDRTEEIVRSFGYTFVDNPEKKAEPGLAMAFKMAKGELFVNFAADNELREKEWLSQMVKPFTDGREVTGALSRVQCSDDDNSFLKYFNSDTDPFSAFFYGNASHPDKFHRMYPLKKKGENYEIYKFDPEHYPLIAFAQGFMIRTSYERSEDTAFDDVLPIIKMIEEGRDIAFVTNVSVGHYVFDDFSHYRRRMLRKVSESFTDSAHGFHVRENRMPLTRRIRQYLFVPYALTLVGPALHAAFRAISTGKLFHFYEVPASFLLAVYIVYMFIVVRVLKTRNKPMEKYH